MLLTEQRGWQLPICTMLNDAPDGERASHGLLFQTSDTTWHAYNGYGGAGAGYTTYGSFHYPFEHAPSGRAMNLSEPGHDLRRAHMRSYNAPLLTRSVAARAVAHTWGD